MTGELCLVWEELSSRPSELATLRRFLGGDAKLSNLNLSGTSSSTLKALLGDYMAIAGVFGRLLVPGIEKEAESEGGCM